MGKIALLIVDLQNDFLPKGALPVAEGDQIVSLVDQLLERPFDVKVATKDWHPKGHGSFAITHHKNPGEIILLGGIEQILWPEHCVQGTFGSEFASGWNHQKLDRVFYKGTEPLLDSYSTFFDNKHLRSTGLEDYFRAKEVTDIYIAGLATDYCVKYSVLDALQLGFKTYVVVDACRGVNLQSEDSEKALNEMKNAGAIILDFVHCKMI